MNQEDRLMATARGADEARAAHYLRAHGLGYTPGPHMTKQPITPTRIIPAGAPLPAWLAPPGDVPPWHTPPPPPPPATVGAPPAPLPESESEPEAQRPIQVYVTVQPGPFYEPEPVPEPTRWDRFMGALRRIGKPWQLCLALTAAVFPIPGPGHGYSIATTWYAIVATTRAEHGMAWGYGLGVGALTVTSYLVAQRPGLLRLFWLAVAFVGSLGAVALFDPITAITGVPR